MPSSPGDLDRIDSALVPPFAGELCPVIVGPTAVGKTRLVLALAERFPIEVISLDSRQLYRGMRIGTAQPTAAEQARVPHHLVDFVPPTEAYSAARFRRDFERVFPAIRARGRVPVVVGGAGLYLAAVAEGLFELSSEEAAAVAAAREELSSLPTEEIRGRLREVDRPSWERIPPRDRYRSQRALEIERAVGRPLSALMAERQSMPSLGLRFAVVRLTCPRAELHRRIAARLDAMLAAGWLEETAALIVDYGPEARGLRTIGYREAVARVRGEMGAAEMRERVLATTRQYAKRQETWFRAVPSEASGTPEDQAVVGTLARLVEEAAEWAAGGSDRPA